MPLANFTPNQFRVHVFSSPSKRARKPHPSIYIIYSFDQGKRHKHCLIVLLITLCFIVLVLVFLFNSTFCIIIMNDQVISVKKA